MLLSQMIKTLTDIAIDCGECEVLITTEKEDKLYGAALFDYIPFDNPILRIEGMSSIDEDKNEEESEEGDEYGEDNIL